MTDEKALVKNGLSEEELAAMLAPAVDMEEQQDLQAEMGMGKINVKTHSVGTTIRCIIIGQHRANGYWPNGFSGNADAPDCAAPDGKLGTGIVDGKSVINKPCASCPKNQWGSARGEGKGKACQNKRIIYVIREVDGVFNPFPEAVQVPATGLRGAAKYLQETMGTPRWTFITEVTFTPGASGMGGYDFKRAEALPVEMLPEVGLLVKAYESARIETMNADGGAPVSGRDETEF